MGFYDKHGRYLLMALTILYMVVGLIIVALAIWTIAALSPAIGGIFLVSGLLVFSLYFLGFRGALTNNRYKLKLFAWISIVLIVLALIGAIFNLTSGRENTTHFEGQGSSVMSFVSMTIQILCIVLAFGLSSAIEQKAVPPPTYATVLQA